MRVAVVAGPAPGHAFPCAALACALARRGHDVCMWTGIDWLPALRRDGVDAQHLPLLAADPRDVDFGFRLWGRAAEMAPAVAEELAAFDADGVVVDTLTVGGQFAADLLGVPWVELIPHPLQDPSCALPAPGTGLAPSRNPLRQANDAWLRRQHARSLARGQADRAAARRSLGLAPQHHPAGRLVATLPGLEPPRPDWPARTAVVGPLEWDPADRDLPLPTGSGPLVFVSGSTAPTGAVPVLEPALQACERLGLRLAATLLHPVAGSLPGWASVGPGRQGPPLAEAAVVVSGAGHGIVAKALVRGRPLVCVPGGGEQYDNAMRIRRLGAGVPVLPRRLSADRLATAVTRVLDRPAYTANARRLAATAVGLGPAYAARAVERFLVTAAPTPAPAFTPTPSPGS